MQGLLQGPGKRLSALQRGLAAYLAHLELDTEGLLNICVSSCTVGQTWPCLGGQGVKGSSWGRPDAVPGGLRLPSKGQWAGKLG